MTIKRKPVKTEADAHQSIRAGTRRLLKTRLEEWAPLFVRSSKDRYRLERIWSGDLDTTPQDAELEFSMADLPVDVRPLVAHLVRLLVEQAKMADAAVPIARAELEADARRDTGRGKAVKTLKADAGERDKRLRNAALAIMKTQGREIKDRALAAMLADQNHGGREAIRKKLPKLLPRKNR